MQDSPEQENLRTILTFVSKYKSLAVGTKSIIREGEQTSENLARSTRAKVATQKTAFLNSGLTLEGTPLDVIEQEFDFGITDIERTLENANIQASSAVKAGRAAAIQTIALSAATLGAGGAFSSAAEPLGAGAFSAGTAARTLPSGVTLPKGLPLPKVGI